MDEHFYENVTLLNTVIFNTHANLRLRHLASSTNASHICTYYTCN